MRANASQWARQSFHSGPSSAALAAHSYNGAVATELQQKLQAGIQAVRAGDLARGRALLLEVVAADERNEPAWLWLSAAVDDPADRLIALENVLVLNPGHPQALAGAAALRRQLGQAPPTSPPPETPARPPAGWPEATYPPEPAPAPLAIERSASLGIEPDEDPDQCPFCGRPAEPDAARCPHCRRSLLTLSGWAGGGYQYLALIGLGLQAQVALLQAVFLWLLTALPDQAQLVPFGSWWADNNLPAAVVRLAVWVALLLALLSDWPGVFAANVVAAVLDLAWAAVAVGLLPILGPDEQLVSVQVAAPGAALSVGLLLISLAAAVSQATARRRWRVVLDPGVVSAAEAQQRAEGHARAGRWATAALHWRRAVALSPRHPAHYIGLGRAMLELGRRPEALAAFRSAAELAPDDEFVQQLPKE